MPKPKLQTFIYELRVWPGTTEGLRDDAYSFSFPVTNTVDWKADRYAIEFGIASWGHVIRDKAIQIETSEILSGIIGAESLATIDDIFGELSGELYGLLIRQSTRSSPGQKIQEYCTVQLGRFNVADATKSAMMAAKLIG